MRKQRDDLGNLIGKKFGRLTVSEYVGTDKHQKRVWSCICDCGKQTEVTTTQLRLGKTQSCGCFKTDTHTTHGDSTSLEYFAWRGMRNRCEDKNNRYFPRYGGRGIQVCERWDVYANFLDDMGRKPTKSHSLDRINNDLDYTPDNCRWATKVEQTRNRNMTKWIEFNGKRQLLCDWANDLGVDYRVLYQRIRLGWSIEKALTTKKRGL